MIRANRREFLLSAGSLAVAVSLPLREAFAAAGADAAAVSGFVTAYLEITADGRVTLHSPTTEMGQGTHTAHAVLVTDELATGRRRYREEFLIERLLAAKALLSVAERYGTVRRES